MSKENQNYQLTERGETAKKATKVVVTALATTAFAIPVYHAAQGSEVNFSGTQEVPAEHGTNPTEMVRENVEYDSNEVPTDEIVDYVVDMPENKEVMSDGLDAGETLVLPEKAEKAD